MSYTETVEVCLPEYWANYLINGDATGLTEDEILEIDDYISDSGLAWAVDIIGEPWFSHRNDANNMGGNVCRYVFTTKQQKL